MNPYKALVMGASAGGVHAVQTIAAQLTDPPWPIVLVQHLQAATRLDYAAAFGNPQRLKIMEAEDKMQLQAGLLYVAPPGYHTLIEEEGTIALSVDPPVNFSRPSIDVLFESAADVYGGSLIALLLTGASHDGAAGMQAIHQRGGLTLVQDPSSAEVATMPAAAIARTPVHHILTLEAIGPFLKHLAQLKTP